MLDCEEKCAAKAEGELRALNISFNRNYVTNDVLSHERLLHPEFSYMSASGLRVAREAYLKNWENGFDPKKIIYWDHRDEQITVIGPVALVRSTNKYIERQNGEEIAGMASYTDTYYSENGAWKCIHAQITQLNAEHWPPDSSIVRIYVDCD